MRLASLAFIVFASLALSSCGLKNRTPRYDVTADYDIKPFKRYSQHQEVDYWFRWQRPAYDDVSRPLKVTNSPDQLDVLRRHGQPDYIRINFQTDNGEMVDEWLYWDRKTTVQFVQRQLVWEGPLTDMDAHRLKYGYPDKAYTQQYEQGPRREFWDYKGLFDRTGKVVSFSDEKLVSTQVY